MFLTTPLPGLAVDAAPALHAERFSAGLAPTHWTLRERGGRRSHLLIVESRRGIATLRSTTVSFEAPALLWAPAGLDCELRLEAGAQGYLIAVSEDFLTKTVAGSAEALHLRRTIDRLVLLTADQVELSFGAMVGSCATLLRELRQPDRGSTTMIASHVLLLCLHLWRSAVSGEPADASAGRGDGPRLVGNFLQLVELHYRDGWPVARYALALGVTDDKLHSHCKREKGLSPRAIVHARLILEACTRLRQLDLPVEQIGYGLGFRDPGYFSRFFRKYQGTSPGAYRRSVRLDQQRGASYAAWP
jgi:AraC-like DNA-binding protein